MLASVPVRKADVYCVQVPLNALGTKARTLLLEYAQPVHTCSHLSNQIVSSGPSGNFGRAYDLNVDGAVVSGTCLRFSVCHLPPPDLLKNIRCEISGAYQVITHHCLRHSQPVRRNRYALKTSATHSARPWRCSLARHQRSSSPAPATSPSGCSGLQSPSPGSVSRPSPELSDGVLIVRGLQHHRDAADQTGIS